ncbi:acyltransferase family protein [Pedobacter cryoconitis]|nr:acyltransferase [Pedobacter cryoconitis]
MRIKQIDILRGIAALLVTIFHLTGSAGLSKATASYGSYGWLGVQIFFVISGFVLPYSMYKTGYNISSFGTFLIKRIVRVYPPYLVAIAIAVAMAIATGRELLYGITLLSHFLFLNELLGLHSWSPVFWTLFIEFQFYILIGILFPIVVSNNYKSLAFVFVMSILSLLFSRSIVVYWFPFFGLGILIFNKYFTNMSLKMFWFGITTLTVLIAYVHGISHAVAGLSAVLFILFVKADQETFFNRALFGLGNISYSLYLVHWELGRAAVNISRHLPFVGSNEVIKVLTGLAFSIISAYIFYILVEKPSVRYSSRIKYNTRLISIKRAFKRA